VKGKRIIMSFLTPLFAGGAMLVGLLACVLGAPGGSESVRDHGTPVNGLRLGIRLPEAEVEGKFPSACEVIIENVGDRDQNLKLGQSLANGKSHHPVAIRLVVLHEGGGIRTLHYKMVGVGGRIDPFVVPMPAGSRFTLRCTFEQFSEPMTGKGLVPGGRDQRLVAELMGEGIDDLEVNSDMKGLALIPLWQGSARSNELVLPPAEKSSEK
jgi:hypothetical protein